MFNEARVKLTAWYLLIIMMVSGIFSGVIYQTVGTDMERNYRRGNILEKMERWGIKVVLPAGMERRMEDDSFLFFDEGEVIEVKKILGVRLLMMNGVVLLSSALLGYFLAGETLKPIEKAMERHKRFVGNASHDLRTPLTVLRTQIEVALRRKKMTRIEAKKVLSKSLEEVEGLQKMTDDLLFLSAHQGNEDRGRNEVNVSVLAGKMVKKMELVAKKKGVRLVGKGEKKLFVKGESRALEKVFWVLLDNGVKYTSKGGKVSVSWGEENGEIVLRVQDLGKGISKDDLPFIFDRFYRGEKSRSREEDGFGLGLSIAREVLRCYGGKIEVKSELGKGSEFTVRLMKA